MFQHRRPHHLEPALGTVRVVLVYKDFKGRGFSHAGLGVTCLCVVKTLRRAGIWADVWACKSADDLGPRIEVTNAMAELRGELPISHVVLAAPWVASDKLAELARRHPEVTWAVNCHSNVGFLAADQEAIRIMRETAELQHITHNVRAAANSERMAGWASEAWGTRFVVLRNLYDLSESRAAARAPWREGTLRIGMFGAARPLKNGITGAAAAVLLADRLRTPVELHVSSGRDEGGSLRPIEEITRGVPNLVLKRAGWLPWPAFRAVMRQMHVHLQPSYTESCNVTVQDGIAENVPSAVGPAISWVPEHWKADIDDACDVARVAEALLHDARAAEEGRRALERYVADGLVGWKRFLLARSAEHQASPRIDEVAPMKGEG
jgi:hypothetical protein